VTKLAAILILYDDGCPLCTFQMRVLTWLDWFDSLTMLLVSSPQVEAIAPNLSRGQLLEAIHCLTADGRIFRGARCIRHLGLRLPLLLPLGLFLWIPGVIWIAEGVYLWVSRNRHRLGRIFGCKEACALLPAKNRQKDEMFFPRPPEQ
jgi:predicted DCC family thiol-disulfide oxidoreductase YuxK